MGYLEKALALLEQRRSECNVRIPHDKELEAKVQKKTFQKYMLHLGRCLEAPGIFYSVGLLDEVGYEQFYTRAMATMHATITGRI